MWPDLTSISTYIDFIKAMGSTPRLSRQTLQVLDAFVQTGTGAWTYGYDISRGTGLKAGTLYPILIRLAQHKLLDTRWDNAEPGKPPRHMYRLTADGLRLARDNPLSPPARRLALSGVKR